MGGMGGGPGQAEPPPARVSVLAVMSLVCSVLCCIPGLGGIGTVLGVAALVRIGQSQGRLAGRGLAISGIIIGLLVSTLWIAGALGAQAMWRMAAGPVDNLVRAIEKQDYATARGFLQQSLQAAATDEQFAKFRDGMAADAGSVKGVTTNLLKLWGQYTELAQSPAFTRAMQSAQQQRGTGQAAVEGRIPMPVEFSNGLRAVVLEFSQSTSGGTPANPFAGSVTNLIFIKLDGSELRLLPDTVPGSAPTPAPPATPAAPAAEANPPTPPPAGGGN